VDLVDMTCSLDEIRFNSRSALELHELSSPFSVSFQIWVRKHDDWTIPQAPDRKITRGTEFLKHIFKELLVTSFLQKHFRLQEASFF
jgi:hypothetical protein